MATAMFLGSVVSFVLWFVLQPQPLAQEQTELGGSSAGLLMLLGGFIFLTLGTAVAVRVFHARSLGSVLGPWRAVVRDFTSVFRGLLILAFVVAILPPYDLGVPLTSNLAPGTWALLLPFTLTAILIQTSAEEIVFRGYLQQQLAARFGSPVVWMVLPTALFAFGHDLPAEAGDNAVIVALWAGIFGLMMADLTARAGNLGPAIAVHFANNLTAIALISLPDSLSGLALFTVELSIADEEALWTLLPVDFGMMILMWLTARLAIRR